MIILEEKASLCTKQTVQNMHLWHRKSLFFFNVKNDIAHKTNRQFRVLWCCWPGRMYVITIKETQGNCIYLISTMKTHMKEHISNQPSIHEEQTIADDINNTLKIKEVIKNASEITRVMIEQTSYYITESNDQTRCQLKSSWTTMSKCQIWWGNCRRISKNKRINVAQINVNPETGDEDDIDGNITTNLAKTNPTNLLPRPAK